MTDGVAAQRFRNILAMISRGESLFVPVLVETVVPKPTERSVTHTTGLGHPANWLAALSEGLADRAALLLGANRPVGNGEKRFTIGRGDGTDVQLMSVRVSKQHATLVVRNLARSYLLVDHHSRNGTFINGDRIAPETETPVWPGAYLTFADAVYVFLDPPLVRKIAQVPGA